MTLGRVPGLTSAPFTALRASVQEVVDHVPADQSVRGVLWNRLGQVTSALAQDLRGTLFRRAKSKELQAEIEAAVPWPREEREQALIRGPWPSVPELPEVTIVIPVYGKLELTVTCLLSVLASKEATVFEVIVMDDASPDRTAEVLPLVHGIRFIRNESNLGFLGTCNRAATLARGKWIYFLNNDTIVLPRFLDALVQTATGIENVGVVGSKLIFPTLKLQECGGIIWQDASGSNFGYGRDPFNPSYGYLRDADYVSFASALVNRKLFEMLGGLDVRFRPAYYEDTDFAFQARNAGQRVLVQPASRVIHFEGGTMGRDVKVGLKKYQLENQAQFREKWAEVLTRHGVFADVSARMRDRRSEQRVLVLARGTPRPDEDSGSVDLANMLAILRQLGHSVTFIPVKLVPRGAPWPNVCQHAGHYTEALESVGIECLHSPYEPSVERYLREHGGEFDVVLVNRARVAHRFLGAIRRYAPQAQVIFNTVDLHYLREEREAEVSGKRLYRLKAKDTKWRELSAARSADVTLVLSELERDVLLEVAPTAKVEILPLIRRIPGRSQGFDGRSGVLFVGGFRHRPNLDAVRYFLAEVWPLVQAVRPELEFWIAGSSMPEEVKSWASASVHPLGHVPDLTELHGRVCVTVAPLRYGAGLKGKVAASLGYGVPCVTTAIGAEGSGLEDGKNIVVRDDPRAIAEAIVRLHDDRGLWEAISSSGLSFAQARYGLPAIEQRMKALLAGGVHERKHAGASRAR
jgi:O-antigen biosynthesis protein